MSEFELTGKAAPLCTCTANGQRCSRAWGMSAVSEALSEQRRGSISLYEAILADKIKGLTVSKMKAHVEEIGRRIVACRSRLPSPPTPTEI